MEKFMFILPAVVASLGSASFLLIKKKTSFDVFMAITLAVTVVIAVILGVSQL